MDSCKKQPKNKKLFFFIVLGILSVIWFLLSVTPKPSRITYPPQRLAAANIVAFITRILGTVFSYTLLKKARINPGGGDDPLQSGFCLWKRIQPMPVFHK